MISISIILSHLTDLILEKNLCRMTWMIMHLLNLETKTSGKGNFGHLYERRWMTLDFGFWIIGLEQKFKLRIQSQITATVLIVTTLPIFWITNSMLNPQYSRKSQKGTHKKIHNMRKVTHSYSMHFYATCDI